MYACEIAMSMSKSLKYIMFKCNLLDSINILCNYKSLLRKNEQRGSIDF